MHSVIFIYDVVSKRTGSWETLTNGRYKEVTSAIQQVYSNYLLTPLVTLYDDGILPFFLIFVICTFKRTA